jgi:pimeloyl-ACP methyl ester carboxylesterase
MDWMPIKLTRRLFMQITTLTFAVVFLTGCDWEKIAQDGLYPAAKVNEKNPVPNAPSGYEDVFLGINVQYPDGTSQAMRVHGWLKDIGGSASTPVVIFFHGNGMNLGSMVSSNLLKMLEDLNAHVAVMDYPGYGKSTGQPSEPAMLAMSNATVDWLQSRLPHRPIYVWGHSLGASVAMGMAHHRQHEIAGWAFTSIWSSLDELAHKHYGSNWDNVPASWKAKNVYNNVALARGLTLPGFVHHGDKDDIIPFEMGSSVFNALANPASAMLTLTGREHNDVFNDPRLWDAMRELLQN